MIRMSLIAPVAMALALGLGLTAHAECKLEPVATIPIVFVNGEPMVEASINGKPTRLRLGIGPETIFWGSALKDYGLKLAGGYEAGGTAFGIGGTAEANMMVIHELKTPVSDEKDKSYYVLAGAKNTGESGILGAKILTDNDIDVDFAHGVVRVVDPKDCNGSEIVSGWKSYNVINVEPSGFFQVKLSGKTLSGSIGVGHEVSFVTSGGARHAGVAPERGGSFADGHDCRRRDKAGRSVHC